MAVGVLYRSVHPGWTFHGHVIEPSRSQKEAEDLFFAFHRRNILAPSNLLENSSTSLVFVPFWTFSVHANAVYTAAVGKGLGQLKSGQAGTMKRDAFSPSTQVPATYHVRPDLAAGLKPSIRHVSSTSWHEASANSIEGIVQELTGKLTTQPPKVLPAALHRGIAWELVMRALRAEEEPRIRSYLQSEHGSKPVRDVHMTLADIERQSSLVYVPGYLFDYVYGEVQDDSLVITKQHHQALVPAAGAPAVLAEPHYSPAKAQGAAMASVLGLQATWAAGSVACTSGATTSLDVLRATSIDMAFWAFLAASAAGVAARGFTQYLRDKHTSGVEEEAETLHAAYMRDGKSPDTVEEPHDLRVRADAEWLRWLEGEKWAWRPERRQVQAERLFAEQAMRRQLSERAARRRAEEKHMFETHAQQHAWKRARYGESERSKVFSGGKRAGGRFDFRGYYKRLGITEHQREALSATEVSEAVKQAYRQAAKRLHPDRNARLPAEQQAVLQQQFQELQTAYEVLRNEDKRRVYDAGGNVDT